MTKEPLRWEPERVSGMTNEEIVKKLKELVPPFDLDSFVAKTQKYLSCEDLTETEYYPQATFSDTDEDFIWMACEELWKRLVPNRPAVEHIAEQFDDLIEKAILAAKEGRQRELVQQSEKTFAFLYPHIIEKVPSGCRLKQEFYEKFREAAYYDIDSFFESLVLNLMDVGDHERAVEVAGLLATAFNDDTFLDYKAESLFALGRRAEAEQYYQEMIARHPEDVSFAMHAGDCYLTYGKEDYAKAKTYYLKALEVARKIPRRPDGDDDIDIVYQGLIDLAEETGDYAEVARFQKLLDHSLGAGPNVKVGRNDPCPCGSGKKYKKCCGSDVSATIQAPPFDERLMDKKLLAIQQTIEGKDFGSVEAMNKYWARFNQTGKMPDWVPNTSLERAQDLVYQALETAGKRRIKLAEEALKVSPDCADAYVLLAEEKARSVEEALSLYESGVKAGERALGKKVFEEKAFPFWGMIETRPYMRARAGLAECLWLIGKQEKAIDHYWELLRLNPNDNQGIRYLLAAALLEMGNIDALEELLGQYDEPTADWLYGKALVAYVKQGDTTEARKLLKEAIAYNPHVVSYLLGEKRLPKELPKRIGFGDKDEAVAYAAEFGAGWHQTEGAVDWLASITGKARGTWQAGKKPAGVPDVFLRAFESENRKGRPKGPSGDE